MASNINPQNIDGAYPVAGQDNDSQGFRDNFTNTRTNFAFAAQEITELQTNAVLKAPLTGTVLDNNMNGSILRNAQLQDISETRVALGTVTGLQSLNYEAGSYYTFSTAGSVNVAFANFPPAGQVGRMRVQITVTSVAHTLTLPSAVSVGTSGVQGYVSGVITFGQTGIFEFEFETSDGGSTITIFDLNRPLSRYSNPISLDVSESFSANGNISLSTTTTVITSSNDLVGNLAAGLSGQIKILAYGNTSSGNTQITVADAAWGGSNIANLNAVGSACTLQYINSKWFCIGNNGVDFS
jgi:hypothetical protein